MGTPAEILSRLETEQLLCEDGHFFTVSDATPVTSDHRLLVSRLSHPSLADCDLDRLAHFLESDYVRVHGRHDFIFERGRAAFCTSFDGAVIGHAHISSAAELDSVNLDPAVALSYDSLIEALKAIPPSGEYLLWGRVFGRVSVSLPKTPVPKRLIRENLESAVARR